MRDTAGSYVECVWRRCGDRMETRLSPAAGLVTMSARSGGTMVYRFEDWEPDAARSGRRRDGVGIRGERQVLRGLPHLLARRGRVVTKGELLDAIWGDRFVSDSALTS